MKPHEIINQAKGIERIRKLIIHGCEARGDGATPYLTRWILIKKQAFAVYFHKFHRSDAEHLHDHPWNFISVILWRGYKEETFKDQNKGEFTERKIKTILPGSIIYRKSIHAHRVILINNKPAYTLVIRFKDRYNWGFYVKGMWMYFNDYFKRFGC